MGDQSIPLMDEGIRRRVHALLNAMFTARVSKDDKIPSQIEEVNQIEEGLYLGSLGAARNNEELKRLNITHILIVARSLEPQFPDEFTYKKIDVLDSPETNLDEYFEECSNFIDEAKNSGGNVLVHCFAGISRSVTIVVAYLMKKHRMSRDRSLSLVQSKRPVAAPNAGFFRQLGNYEKSLSGKQ